MAEPASRFERVIICLAALVCLLFMGTLNDLSLASLRAPQLNAPRLPDDVTREASLTLRVTEADGSPASGVLVRVFAIVADRAYLANSQTTAGDGSLSLPDLPAGETWVIAERAGSARTTTRLVLDDKSREVTLKLADAEAFEVVVVDPLQRPIRGVRVTLYGGDPLPHRTTTDQRGLAHFESLGPAPYAVEIAASGFDAKLLPRVGLGDSPLFVKLERLGGLEVTVVDSGGQAVSEATVLVTGSALWPARSSTTDSEGRVNIAGLPRGFYDLRAEKGEQVSDAEDGVLLERGEHKAVKLTLVAGTRVTVTVTDGDDEDAVGIADADVALVEGGISSFPRYGRTDARGVVELGPVIGADATVSARADGYVARSAVPLEEDQTEVRVSLMKGGVLVGQVVDERDYPIDGAQLEVIGVGVDGMPVMESSRVAAFRDDHFAFALPGATPLIPAGELGVMPIVPDIPRGPGALTVTRSERTDSPWVAARNGEFELTPVTPGRLRLVARHPGYVEAISDPFDLVSGGRGEVKLVMRRGGILEGRVVEHNGTPVAGARIEVASVFGSLERVSYSADDGTFAFAALPSSIVLMVSRPERPENIVERLTIDIVADERRQIEVVLPEPRDPVTIRVTDDRGYPIEQVEIHASSLELKTALRKTLFSDDAGEAELLDARGLSLRVVVSRRRRAPGVFEFERAPAEIDLTMWPALNAVGTVETRWGPVADAELTLVTPTGARHARSDERGHFRFEDLAPVPSRMLVVAKGHVPHEADVVIEGDGRRDVDLGAVELVKGGVVVGVVVDERGDPIAGVRVASGRVPTYLPLGKLPIGVASTNREGRFRLEDLPEGRTIIQAYKVGFERAEADAEIRAGREARDIRLELIDDPETDATTAGLQASLAVTLGERVVKGKRIVIFEHVPFGGEAQRAGMLAGDRFLTFGGVPIRSLEQARRRLNGPISQDMVIGLWRDPNLRWRVRVRREKLRR